MSAARWAAAICALVLCVASAGAQPGAGTPEPGTEQHAWIATALLEGEGAALFHLPPRGQGLGFGAADAGVARLALTLGQQPVRLAWWGRRVYLLYAPTRGELDAFSLRVVPTSVGGYWATDPASGAVAELTLRAARAGFEDAACTPDALLVLTRDEAWRLWRLDEAGWATVDLPAELSGAGAGALRLIAGSRSPAVLQLDEAGARRWLLEPTAGWAAAELTPAAPAEATILACFESAGDACLALRAGEGPVEVWSLGPALRGRLTSVGVSGTVLGTVPLEGGSRLALLTLVHDAGAAGRLEPVDRWEIVEVSLATGRELYRGLPRSGSPISGSDIRWLSLGMVALTLGVLFYLLRPGPARDATALPAGCALAEPGRRLAAGLLDAAMVAAVVSLVFGVPIQHVLLAVPLFESAHGVMAFAAFVASGTAYSTVAEWLTGRTIGKALAGCRVVSVIPGRVRPGFMRCGIRNLFRWGLAPWAAIGLVSGDGRHRGDRAAGAAVVIAIERGGDVGGERGEG